MFKKLIISLMIILLATAGTPLAYAYLSSLDQQGIAIRAADASEIWAMNGSFNEGLWKENGDTGITITNLCHRDLWIFYEYKGDLKQVFKQSGPVLVKSGQSVPVVLKSLDDKDSPRLLNPLDLIEFNGEIKQQNGGEWSECQGNHGNGVCNRERAGKCAWQWKKFKGTVKIHTLNCYAELETAPLAISGETLWNRYFSRKYPESPDKFYASAVQLRQQDRLGGEKNAPTAYLQGGELGNVATAMIEDEKGFLERVAGYQPGQYLQQVLEAVQVIAPDFWADHQHYRNELAAAMEKMQQSIALLESFISEQQRLQDIVFEQQETIQQLRQQIGELENEDSEEMVIEDEPQLAEPLQVDEESQGDLDEEIAAEPPAEIPENPPDDNLGSDS